jgi:hypothetical protein
MRTSGKTCRRHAEVINADLLAQVKGCRATREQQD